MLSLQTVSISAKKSFTGTTKNKKTTALYNNKDTNEPSKKINDWVSKMMVLPCASSGNLSLIAKYFAAKKSSLLWVYGPIFILRRAVPANAIQVPGEGITGTMRHIVLLPFFNAYNFLSKQYLSKTLIVNSVFLTALGSVSQFTLVGYNYTAYYENHTIFFNLGYSHVSAVRLPLGVFVTITNKRSIFLYGANGANLQWVVARIQGLKTPSVFTGKGLLKGTGRYKVKKRAGQ